MSYPRMEPARTHEIRVYELAEDLTLEVRDKHQLTFVISRKNQKNNYLTDVEAELLLQALASEIPETPE